MPPKETLEIQLLVALKQAMREDKLDVAEHILAALETLDTRPARQAMFYRQMLKDFHA